MANEFKWPTDPEFRRVAAKIADAVTVHINSGGRIIEGHLSRRGGPECRCPIGCVGLLEGDHAISFPNLKEADCLLGTTHEEGWRFYDAFDFGSVAVGENTDDPYAQLGLAYRRRFVEGVK